VIGAVTAGAALDFLPVNSPRAFVFLCDVGSYLLGAFVWRSTAAVLAVRHRGGTP